MNIASLSLHKLRYGSPQLMFIYIYYITSELVIPIVGVDQIARHGSMGG